MKHILLFTNPHREIFYFVNHGETFGANNRFRLIAETTRERSKARRFDSHEAAMDALKLSDDPPSWTIDEVQE